MALSYLSVLLRGGVRLVDTLNGIAQYYHGTALGRKFTQWSGHLQSGIQIADAFQKSGFQDDLTLKLLHSGAVTNQIGDTFKLAHQIHQAHFTHALDKTMSMLQPATYFYCCNCSLLYDFCVLLSLLRSIVIGNRAVKWFIEPCRWVWWCAMHISLWGGAPSILLLRFPEDKAYLFFARSGAMGRVQKDDLKK